MARYPNLRAHRVALGWSIGDLLRRTEQPPSEKSVRRIESGLPIMLRTVNRLFAAIEKAWTQTPSLDRMKEIVVER